MDRQLLLVLSIVHVDTENLAKVIIIIKEGIISANMVDGRLVSWLLQRLEAWKLRETRESGVDFVRVNAFACLERIDPHHRVE